MTRRVGPGRHDRVTSRATVTPTHAGGPTDQSARDRIERDFSTNFLVEAGAGSGKTRSLARRMAAGIAAGEFVVEGMSAVTFTRKAAAELRGRFQEALEERLRGPITVTSPAERPRLEQALRSIERLFAGTIHAFCAHLLRERPVEARVAQGFVELDEIEDARRRRQAWREFIVRERAGGSAQMVELQAAGVRPRDLDGAFALVCQHEDVDFPGGSATMPDADAAWRALETFWNRFVRLLPKDIDRESRCRALALAARFGDQLQYAKRWRRRPATVAEFLGEWRRSPVTMKWWDETGREAKDLVDEFRETIADPFVAAWRKYVYRIVSAILTDARAFYAEQRRRQNVVNYVDLLLVAARLLRENPAVRHALQEKHRWLFIDEFQDTDPIQAEIFLLLAADDARGAAGATMDADSPADVLEWTRVPLRPGALFVVGDPKQSIYRFRRADIDIYNRVRDRIVACGGEVLHLTANWRSLPGVCDLVNRVFSTRLPALPSRESPAFEALDPRRQDSEAPPGPRLARLVVPSKVDKGEVPSWEAERIARFIRAEVASGRRRYGSFLVLTRNRPRLKQYADAFDRFDVPVAVSGAGRFAGSEQVEALAALLASLSDPLDGVALVGVLRGPLFGLSDDELFAFRQAGGRFELVAPLTGGDAALMCDPALTPPGDVTPATLDRERAFGPVLPAIRQLRTWRDLTRRLPLGAAVERMLEQSGWLAVSASGSGGARAGDLIQAVDMVRQVVESGGGLADAVDVLTEDDDVSNEVEVLPLEPGRRDVVRLMNLHKAKGLEAEVVFLADPANAWQFDVDVRVVREGNRPTGFLAIGRSREGQFGKVTLAEPAGWDVHSQDERRYRDAEVDRLLYVAATRARDLLVVGQWAKRTSGGQSQNDAWGVFDPFLARVGELAIPEDRPSAPRPRADLSQQARESFVSERGARDAALRQASWRVSSVTGEHPPVPTRAARVRDAMGPEPGVDEPRGPETRLDEAEAPLAAETPTDRVDAGAAWGSLVHGLLEHAMRHADAGREDLRRLALWLTVERPELRPHIPAALEVIEAVRRAEIWRDVRSAAECHAEVPFAVRIEVGEGDASRAVSSRASAESPAVAVPVVLRGVVDLAYRVGEGWRILDYKTDQDAGGPGTLAKRHAAQLAGYKRAWADALGVPPPRVGVFGIRVMRTDWDES